MFGALVRRGAQKIAVPSMPQGRQPTGSRPLLPTVDVGPAVATRAVHQHPYFRYEKQPGCLSIHDVEDISLYSFHSFASFLGVQNGSSPVPPRIVACPFDSRPSTSPPLVPSTLSPFAPISSLPSAVFEDPFCSSSSFRLLCSSGASSHRLHICGSCDTNRPCHC